VDPYELQIVRSTMQLLSEAFESLRDGQRQAAIDALVDAQAQLETIAR